MRGMDVAGYAGLSGGGLSMRSRQVLARAFDQATSALDLVDSTEAPAEIGANLQTAVDQIRVLLSD